MIKKYFLIYFITISSVMIYSLTNSEKSFIDGKKSYLTIIDSLNREVVLQNEPRRVVSLAPNITESIYYLEGLEKLIARTDFCDYPISVKEIDSIGTLYNPNIEKIVELNPDLILASTHFDSEILERFEEVGLSVVILLEEGSFDGLYKNLNILGKILNRERESLELVDSIITRVNRVKDIVKDLKRPSVYYVIGYGEYGEFTAGGDTFISEIIELAGGDNIAKESKGWNFTLEKIVEKNPDIFICSKYNNAKEGISSSNGYKELESIKAGRIFEIDNNTIDRHGPRIIDGLETIANILHPGKFQVED